MTDSEPATAKEVFGLLDIRISQIEAEVVALQARLTYCENLQAFMESGAVSQVALDSFSAFLRAEIEAASA